MKPRDAVKLEKVKLVKSEDYPPEEGLPDDGLYRYLLQPGEEHGHQRKSAADRISSKNTYRINRIVEQTSNRTLFYLKGGPNRSFMKEELMIIPVDTELPPDYVQDW